MGFEQMGFELLEKELERLGEIETYAPKMLREAAPILEERLQAEVQNEANKGYAKGDLKKSIKANKPSKNKYGHYVAVTARGKDRKGVRNNEKLAYLNYGTQQQEARPVIAKAIKGAERECMEAMQRKFDEVTNQ